MIRIFSDMVENYFEVSMDDFFIFIDSFKSCLTYSGAIFNIANKIDSTSRITMPKMIKDICPFLGDACFY